MTLDCKMASRRLPSTLRLFGVRYMSGEWGSGAGKGGGSGGSVREAGGSFGKMEAAQEEQYFRKLRHEQLGKLKDMMEDEIEFHQKQQRMHQQAQQLSHLHDHLEEEVKHHETQIGQHKEAIDRHKKKIAQLKQQEEQSKK